MKFTKIPQNTFRQLQLNAGVILANFDPDKAEVKNEDIIGATTGGVSFTATPEFIDFGEDIDNCPKNMKELKQLDQWDVKLSGNFVTMDAKAIKRITGAADEEDGKITPRRDVSQDDFEDLWWVGDYGEDTTDETGGFIAIKMMNTLSTGGFQITSSDKAKGQFAFEFTAHFSMDAQDTVPFEVYVKDTSAAVESLAAKAANPVKAIEK